MGGVALDFIRPGKPVENASVETLDGLLPDESLQVHNFVDAAHAKQSLEAWRLDYNRQRAHGARSYLTPSEPNAVSNTTPTGPEASEQLPDNEGNASTPVASRTSAMFKSDNLPEGQLA